MATIPANTLLLFPAFTQSSPFRCFNLFTSTFLAAVASHCQLCLVYFSQKEVTPVFFLVWFLLSSLLVSINSIKALAHMLSFHAALSHRRNRDDQRKVCHAAECGFPPLLSSPLWFAFFF